MLIGNKNGKPFWEGLFGSKQAPTNTAPITATPTATSTPVDKVIAMILEACITPKSRDELMTLCQLKSKKYFLKAYIKPLLENGQLRMTIPYKPNSQNQKYINPSVMVQ